LYLSGGTRSAAGTGEVGTDPARGDVDFWVMKFNPQTRQILWSRRFGGIYYDFPYSLVVSTEGTVYVGGPSQSPAAPPLASNNGKNAAKLGGSFDGWIVALTPDGQKINDFGFGGSGQDEIYFMQEDRSRSGQLVVGGFSNSPVSGNKTAPLRGNFDYWVFGVEPNGTKMWEWTAGGTDADVLYYLDQLPSGALVLGGTSLSPKSFEKSENPAKTGLADFWLLGTYCDVVVKPGAKDPLIACTADTYGLEAKVQNCTGCEVEWSNGTSGARTELPAGTVDTLRVLARDVFLCFDEDTIAVDIGAPPSIDIGPPDTLLLAGDTLRLGSGDPALLYKWNTGDTTAQITVQRKGLYAVTATNARGCTASDQIIVTRTRSEGIWVPNAFSPNGDGVHDLLRAFTDRSVRNILSFQIADRWGNLLFQRKNLTAMDETDGWDGVFRGQPLAPGVYTWTAAIEYLEGPNGYFSGTITLIR
jgi:gliding motility-associated-like protein